MYVSRKPAAVFETMSGPGNGKVTYKTMELVQGLYRSAIRWVVGVASPDLNVLADVGFVELLQIVSADADAADWSLRQFSWSTYIVYTETCAYRPRDRPRFAAAPASADRGTWTDG